ncbi:unnamed protein product [Heterosigma akashiwo]
MINHIDEGLFILNSIGTSPEAKRAFVIHPMFQSDGDLEVLWQSSKVLSALDNKVLVLALEYRNIANAHLSCHPPGLDEFKLSPIKEVNDMLIADKIQNYKDFLLYHKGSHPHSKRLENYFREWMTKLGVSKRQCHGIIQDLLTQTGGKYLALLAKNPCDECKICPGIDQKQFPVGLRVIEDTNSGSLGALLLAVTLGIAIGALFGRNEQLPNQQS